MEKISEVEPINFKQILVFYAHPDDEIIGMGGTIVKLASQGSEVILVGFTLGETGYPRDELKGKLGKLRKIESSKGDKVLGIKERLVLEQPSQEVRTDRETYQECIRLIRYYRPKAIFTHYFEDKHRDHRAISKVIDEARWKASENILSDLGSTWYTPHLYFYEIFELFTHPSLVVDITATMEKKIEAMKTQKTQLEVYPDILEYIRGVGSARGFLRGTKYAEAFLNSHTLPVRG